MNAGKLLREVGLDTPELRERIAPVDPDSINVWPAARWIRHFWRPGIKGVTHYKWVLVDPEFLRGDRRKLAKLVVHELVHVRQYVERGYLRFISRYIADYWKGRFSGKDARQAYLDIPAEKEARDVTNDIVT